MPFTPSEIMTAGKIARFAMQFDHFDDVITPVIDQLVELYPQGKGYDPEEAYMQYLTPAADAMFVALFLMVLVRSMLNAMNDSTRDGIVEGFTGAVQVHRAGFLRNVQASPLALDLPADDAFLATLRAVPHVRAVAPRIPFGGLVNAHDRTVFALFVAVDPVEESRVCKDRIAQLA